MTTYLLQQDPCDGADRVWAFEASEDAERFIKLNQAYYEDSRYDGDAWAKIITEEDARQHCESLPTPVPAGNIQRLASDAADRDGDVDDNPFDEWIWAHEDLHCVDYVLGEDE
jgi:hypothetical protein